ncbi:MAG: hypothetical protein HC854_07515 [Flavobacterium sp.]|nr:hypothetical protein [Flavobacterium sp.]
MKTKLFTSIVSFFFAVTTFAQDKTTVRANSSDISDNLDLRAVATIFGDASNLEDFERRLNDPKSQISNLDLNNDNYVDYLRVIESIEGNAHIIVVQAVLDKDIYQDVASIELEKDRNNNIQVQVVGDVYMYGSNYIYEPVYVHRPIIYTNFWVTSYRPYCSVWYWNYYPTYYTYWNPCPIFRYRNNVALYINFGHTYNYVNTRRCAYAYNNYYSRRANGYEARYPNRSFSSRNSGYSNRYEMDQNRTIRTQVPGSRELAYTNTRNSSNTRGDSRSNSEGSTRANSSTRNDNYNGTTTRNYSNTRNNSATRENSITNGSTRSNSSTRNTTSTSSPREYTATRDNSSSSRIHNSTTGTSRDYSSNRNNSNLGSSRNTTSNNRGNANIGNSGNYSRQTGNSDGGRSSSSNRGGSGRG